MGKGDVMMVVVVVDVVSCNGRRKLWYVWV